MSGGNALTREEVAAIKRMVVFFDKHELQMLPDGDVKLLWLARVKLLYELVAREEKGQG